MANAIQIDIIANTKKFRREMSTLGDLTGINKLKSGVKKLGKALAVGAVAAGAAVAVGAKKSIQLASEQQQAIGGVDAVFKKNAGTIHKWGKQAATSVGLNRTEYSNFSTLLGSQFKNMGVSQDQLAGKTKGMIGIGADLAAQFGGSSADAVGALSAAFKGEFNSLEKYGITLKATTIEQEAWRLAGVDSAKAFGELSDKEQSLAKQRATTNLITKQSADAHGAFARESNTLAGQQQRLKAKLENVGATIGTYLLPVVTKLVSWLSDNLEPAFKRISEYVATKVVPAVKDMADSFKRNVLPVLKSEVVPALQTVGQWLLRAGSALAAFGGWALKNRSWLVPLVATITAMVLVVMAAVRAYRIYQQTMLIVTAVTKTVRAVQLGMTAATYGTAGANLVAGTSAKVYAVALRAQAIASRIATIASKGMFRAIGVGIKSIPIIGWIIAVVGALVWFFTSTKTGRKIVAAAWKGIKKAIAGVTTWWTKTAWPAIRKALSAMGGWFKMIGRNVAKAWRGMGNGLKATWRWIDRYVIKAFIRGLKIWAALFRFVGRKVVAHFKAVWTGLKRIWGWIKTNVIDRFVRGLRNLQTNFRTAKAGITKHFTGVYTKLKSTWNSIKAKVFGALVKYLGPGGVLRNAFRAAKNKIGEIWADLKSKAKAPVKFLIQTVWDNGLRVMLNKIPGVSIKKMGLPDGFARGGGVNGPGTGTSDSIMARLSKGEHVWTAKEVKAAGGQGVMYRMREAVLKGNLNGDPKFAKGGALTSEMIARGQAFAKRQSGKPYVWGAVGPGGYDCSGFMSAITNVIRGAYAHSRIGATASFPWSGFKRGPGQFTIGSTSNYGGSGIGHMVGNLGGLGVESRGGSGVILGPGAMSTASGAFTQYHLGAGGKAAQQGGGFFSTLQDAISLLKGLPGQVTEMMSKGGWMVGYLKKMVKGPANLAADYVDKKIAPLKIPRGNIPIFDNGGTLGRGLNLVNNATGAPERLYRNRDKGTNNTYHITVTVPVGGDKAAIGRELVSAIDAYESKNGRKRR